MNQDKYMLTNNLKYSQPTSILNSGNPIGRTPFRCNRQYDMITYCSIQQAETHESGIVRLEARTMTFEAKIYARIAARKGNGTIVYITLNPDP